MPSAGIFLHTDSRFCRCDQHPLIAQSCAPALDQSCDDWENVMKTHFTVEGESVHGPAGRAPMLELLEQQQRLTANQWKIIATANLGDMLDFFDLYLIGYVLAFIIGGWQLTFGQTAMILLSSGLGAVPGAFFWGWMADRLGRRLIFMATALNVALATGIMAFTPDQDAWVPGWLFLAFFRFFVGFGNAGLIAVDIPLVQEFVPSY